MSDTPNIDIRPDHWQIVRDILRKHVPQYAVWAFGSRAKWLAKQYSDLDLAIITDQPCRCRSARRWPMSFPNRICRGRSM